MKNALKILLGFLEYVALFLVGYYGIKYVLIAGPIFFGNPWGTVIGCFIIFLFVLHILRKEGAFKL